MNIDLIKTKVLPFCAFIYTFFVIAYIILDSSRVTNSINLVLRESPIVVVNLFLAYYFYALSKMPFSFLAGKRFLKIFLHILFSNLIFLIPIAYFDLNSHGWFSGLLTMILLVVILPLTLILSSVSYYLDTPNSSTTRKVFHLILIFIFGLLQIISSQIVVSY
ncbi:MAG: hypothetical protein WC794_00875 [Candidatus Doudnabacteria bacterium]|jgi:hypothetical protein